MGFKRALHLELGRWLALKYRTMPSLSDVFLFFMGFVNRIVTSHLQVYGISQT